MRRSRAAVKLAGIVAALAAVPTVLYATAGNPLPAWPIDWGLVAESLSTGAIATSTWLHVVAVGGWLLWSYLIIALTVDVVATVRNRPSPVRTAPVRWLASTIVALATQLSTVNMVLSPTPATIDVQAAAASYDPTGTADTSPIGENVPEGTRVLVVSEGDSWAGFAQTAVGDAAAGPAIRTLNEGRDVGGRVLDGSESFVEAGWHLVVPTAEQSPTAVPVADDNIDGVPKPAAHEPDEPVDDESWTVKEGEHFWSIAETTLEDFHDSSPSEEETASYWRELIDANEDRLLPPHDPDLIYPGQQVVVPAPPIAADADAPVEAPDTDLEPSGSPPAGPASTPNDSTDDLPQPGHSPQDEARDDPEPAEAQPPAADVHTPERPVDDLDDRAADVSDQDVGPDEVEADVTRWGVPVGLTAGTAATMLLAGGVLGLLRRRRRLALQQRRVQVRLPPLTPDQLEQAGRLGAAEPPGEVLDELADLFSSIPAFAAPVLVQVRDDGSVGLIFDPDHEVATPPPAPWAVREDPAVGQPQWIATLGDRGPRRSIGLPLLVTLGRHGTTTLLANVDAMRLLAVTADDAATVRRRLRAFALETATSGTSGPLEVTVAGDPGWGGVERIRLIDDPAAEVAASADEVAQSIIADDRLPRLIICHDPADVPGLPAGLDLVGVIAADGPSSVARWRLHLDETAGMLHRPDGAQVTFDSPDFDPDLVTDELAALDVSLSAVPSPADPADDPTDDVTATAGDSDSPEEYSTELPGEVRSQRGWCEVGVLGRFTVTCGSTPLDTLSQTVGQVLAYLATHPKTTSELLEDAVWAGQAAGSGNRVRSALTRLRTELGASPDGEPLVPRRGPREQTIRLSPEVTTDLDRAFAHLDAADRIGGHERLDQLLAALDLVRGTPFEDMPVSWATDIAHRAVARLQDAALDAATELLAAGRLDDAEHAIVQGLKLFDPCEPLYVVWAQIEDARDRRHRIPQLWTRLRQRYADEADETFDIPTTPTAATEQAFAALTGRGDAHP